MRIIGNDPSVPRQTQEVASGTLPSGKPVVVNSDGTVSVVEIGAASIGSAVEFEDSGISYQNSAYDTANDKIVIVYTNTGNSNYLTAVVGTVSGTSISFGTPVIVNSIQNYFPNIAFDENAGKFVITYSDTGNATHGRAVVATVSGTSITLGSHTSFASHNVQDTFAVYDSAAQKVVIAYRDGTDNSGKAIVGTISGTSITFGSAASFHSATTTAIGIAYDSSNNKIIFAYRDGNNSNQGTAVVGTVSGTSISFGSDTIFETTATQDTHVVYDSGNDKINIFYEDGADSDKLKGVIGTVSGTSISFTSVQELYTDAYVSGLAASYDVNAGKTVLSFRGASAYGYALPITSDGSTFTVGSSTIITTNAFGTQTSSVYDPDQKKVVIHYQDGDDSDHGKAQVYNTPASTLTSENYIGMSRGPAFQTGSAASVGSAAVFESASTGVTASTFDSSNNRIVISYRDSGNSNYATVVVGTVSGSSISFGTPTVIRSAAVNNEALITFDSNSNKVIAGYSHNALGKCKVLTVDPSDNSISVGSETTFDTQQGTYLDMTFDSTNNKVVVVYTGQNNYVETKVGTVSGTSISFGTAVVAMSLSPDQNTITFDSNRGKVVVCSRISTKGRAAVGTVSGTSISFASNVIFADNQTKYIAPTFDSNSNKVVIAYINGSSTDQGQVVVGDIDSSGVISFGSAVTYNAEIEEFQGIAFDSNLNKVVIAYDSKPTSKGQVITGTVSGTSITLDSETVFEAASVEGVSVAFDSNANKSVISYIDAGNSNYGTSVVFTPTTIATTRGQVADGGHALIDTQGAISDNQIGLTAGQSYFVQNDGTIGTTADSPSVFAGTAVSATKLIVKG